MHEILEELNVPEVRLFGFDSFEGLPLSAFSEDNRTWLPGEFKCDLELTKKILTDRGIDWGKVHLIKGWFKDTLTEEVKKDHIIREASIIMIDCDLYSSSKDALDF